MQKIMFNDKYGLTDAVLAKRKTQTRRIITNKDMLKVIKKFDTLGALFTIYFRFLLNPDLRERFIYNRRVMRYQKNETVAIAQSYADITPQVDWANCMARKEEIGWNNKMFVRAEDMPHHIRITNIRIERLQDIKSEDCLKEGLWMAGDVGLEGTIYWYHGLANFSFRTPQDAYASLIDRISGKGTWESNPYVFVYDFELID